MPSRPCLAKALLPTRKPQRRRRPPRTGRGHWPAARRAPEMTSALPRSLPNQTRRTAIEPLVPPKPNELDRPMSIFICRASFAQ
ncbi:hypothetical protein YH64_000660 [Achromobacter sp. LC458]|nr:hypothetical protein YH64_000660 [Achromobacter sp. LC458]